MMASRIPRAGTDVQTAQKEQEFAYTLKGKIDYDFYSCRRDTLYGSLFLLYAVMYYI
jgi:hypothetical protein